MVVSGSRWDVVVGDRDGDVVLCLGIGMSLNLCCKSYKIWVNVGVWVISSCWYGGCFWWRGRNLKKIVIRIYLCIIWNYSRCGVGIVEILKVILLWCSFFFVYLLYCIICLLEKILLYNLYCRVVYVILCSYLKIIVIWFIYLFLIVNYCLIKFWIWLIYEM